MLTASLVAASVIWWSLAQRFKDIARENHEIEYSQLALMVGACGLFGWVLLSARAAPNKWAAAALGLFNLSIVLRELESNQPILKTLDAASGYVILGLWATFVCLVFPRRDDVFGYFVAAFRTWAVRLTLIGVVFYAAAWPFDKFHSSTSFMRDKFTEELLEFHGSVCFLVAAICLLIGRPARTESIAD